MKFYRFACSCAPLLFIAVLSGCGDDDVDGEGGDGDGDAPTAWVGDEPHLAVVGSVAGEAFDLSADGSDASDVGTLFCERNYIVPDLEDDSAWANDGYLQKVEIKFNYTSGDAFAEFQMELEAEDLMALVGEDLTIGDEADAQVGLTIDPDGPNEEEFEEVSASGTVTLELLSGEVGADGLTVPDGEGAFGAYVDIELADGGSIQGSFTANCGDNDLEIPEE